MVLTRGQFHRKCSRYLSSIWVWKILITSDLLLHLLGANELMTAIKSNQVIIQTISGSSRQKQILGCFKPIKSYLTASSRYWWVIMIQWDPSQCTVKPLTHWGRDKMAVIFQTTFSNAFSWIKMFKFRLRFHWSLFPGIQLTIFQHWFR